MIIEMLLDALYAIFSVLTLPINIPDLPEQIYSSIEILFEYLLAGAGILNNFVPVPYLLVLLGIIVAVDVGIMLYNFVMWILKKIPMLNIK